MLDVPLFTIRQLYLQFSLLFTTANQITTYRAGIRWAITGPVATFGTGARRLNFAGTGTLTAGRTWFLPHWFAVPFRIAEMVMGFYEVINRKVVLSVVKPCAAPDDLFELNHRVDRAHQHDVADISGVYTGG